MYNFVANLLMNHAMDGGSIELRRRTIICCSFVESKGGEQLWHMGNLQPLSVYVDVDGKEKHMIVHVVVLCQAQFFLTKGKLSGDDGV